MNILVISNLYPPHGIGGYEERCLHTVEALRQRGHTVDVLTSNHQVEGRNREGEMGIYRELEIHGFYGNPWLSIHKLYSLEKKNQKVLKRLISKLKPDVVHVWNMGGISKSLLHTLEKHPTPLVYDISDHWIARSLKADVWLSWWNDKGSSKRKILRGFLKLLGLRSLINKRVPTSSVKTLKFENIYFCSAFMRNLTVSKGYPVDHADIVYCGVETDLFSRKISYKKIQKFLWVGRLAEDKDPLTTIRGFLKAKDATGQPLELDVYGKGEETYVNQLQKEIQDHQANNSVRIKSASHKEMRHLYSTYDVYVFSSNWGEPFALTPLEAMSSGVPVIMCPDGGDTELLQDGVNAFAFEAANPESLSNAIQRFLNLEDKGESLAKTAFTHVSDKFTVKVMTDKIESILQRVVSTHG